MLKLYIQGRDFVTNFGKNEDGASLAEYALLIALVLVGAAATITLLTTAISNALDAGTAELTPVAAP